MKIQPNASPSLMFRGIEIDYSSEQHLGWVQGMLTDYSTYSGGTYRIENTNVDPNTICEWTGAYTNKSGELTPIYEGDITDKGVVRWDEYHARWVMDDNPFTNDCVIQGTIFDKLIDSSYEWTR